MAIQAVKFYNHSKLTMLRPGPAACDLCGARLRVAARLCPECEADLPRLGNTCVRCAIPLPVAAETCARCARKPPAFDRCRAPFLYQFPIDAMIRRYKFHQALELGQILGERLTTFLVRDLAELPERIDALVPVPLHVSRLRERGYNQAAELTRIIAGVLHMPVRHDLCARTRPTAPQAQLSATERVKNLRGAFAASGDVAGLRLAIVDDVVTSGETANALAKTLRRAGASYIEVWALARAGF
jgi:ComF family protein